MDDRKPPFPSTALFCIAGVTSDVKSEQLTPAGVNSHLQQPVFSQVKKKPVSRRQLVIAHTHLSSIFKACTGRHSVTESPFGAKDSKG